MHVHLFSCIAITCVSTCVHTHVLSIAGHHSNAALVYIWMYIYVHRVVYIWMYIYVHWCTYECIFMYIEYTYIHMYTSSALYVYLHVFWWSKYTYIHMHLSTCATRILSWCYVYVHINTYTCTSILKYLCKYTCYTCEHVHCWAPLECRAGIMYMSMYMRTPVHLLWYNTTILI